jgi:hypothetical protein
MLNSGAKRLSQCAVSKTSSYIQIVQNLFHLPTSSSDRKSPCSHWSSCLTYTVNQLTTEAYSYDSFPKLKINTVVEIRYGILDSRAEHELAKLVEAIRYKSEGRGFHYRWDQWDF